jgi:hypothetical protein
MMHSSFDDDDHNSLFAPNPFRSNDGDLLGTTNVNPPPPQQQQQQYVQQPWQQQQQYSIPDPGSGMTGSFSLPAPSPPKQQQQFLQGTMDQNANYGSPSNTNNNNNESNGSDGICSIRFWTSCVRLETYQVYFDVDTADVVARLQAALLHFYKPDYFRNCLVIDAEAAAAAAAAAAAGQPAAVKGPDLYGPLWLGMTFMFLLAVTSNLAAYHHYVGKHHPERHHATAANGTSTAGYEETQEELFEYDMTLLFHAMTVVTTFAWGLPSVFWLICTCLFATRQSPELSWSWWICTYGYSMTPLLLASLVAWLPHAGLLVLALATVASGLLVLRNMSTPLLEQQDHAKAAPLIVAIPATHFIMACVLKASFYSPS